MTETTTPAVFDGDLIDEVGATHDVPAAALREHLAAVQELAAYHDGVDAIVYDWRTSSGSDPLFGRTSDRWELVVDAGVWRDFADRLDLGEEALRAVMAVHDRQLRRFAAERDARPGLGEPMVLARE